MEKTKLIGTVVGTSALLTAILCGCCGCDCNGKKAMPPPGETAQIIVIAPSAEESLPCPCKMCQAVKQQIKRMKKSEVLDGAKHHPKVKRDKGQCDAAANCPFKKAAAAAQNGNQNNNGDDVVSESFSIIAVEAVPAAPAAAPAKPAAAAPAKPAAAPQSPAPAAPQAK